jgi:hypothetical protein
VGLKSFLSSILGSDNADQPPARGRANGKAGAAAASPATRAYAAVSIMPGARCCEAATHASDQRSLVREIGKLPLEACTMPEQCACRFFKYTDRRDGDDRRLFGWDGTSAWHLKANRRLSRGRRTEDA